MLIVECFHVTLMLFTSDCFELIHSHVHLKWIIRHLLTGFEYESYLNTNGQFFCQILDEGNSKNTPTVRITAGLIPKQLNRNSLLLVSSSFFVSSEGL